MIVTVLSQASSYNPGSDLWVVPELNSSKTTQKMDWYLNFQLAKAFEHTPAQVSPQLRLMIEQAEIKIEKAEVKNNSWLISSQHLLPNRWVYCLEGSQYLHSWLVDIHHAWKKLGSPSLRIFLPPSVSPGDFQPLLGPLEFTGDITVVVD